MTDARSPSPTAPAAAEARRGRPTDVDVDALRRLFLEFFEGKDHLVYPSASLESDDPTLMFTSAGMVQFKPYFLGATPKFAGYEGVHHRVTTAQKCLRINDIENVGRTLRHHSFFEMLGNFSFGDYFKPEAAAWAWEFLTEVVGLDPERLYVTIYTDDDPAYDVWVNEVGVPAERVSRWGEDENFWPANAVSEGPNGPCGPCSEIFYDRGPEYGSDDEDGPNTGSGDRFVEVWNLVFTQFDRKDGGELEPLPQQNIDTGLGFERFVAVVTGAEDAYATPLFQPTIQRVAELSGKPYEGMESTSHRVIADHVRAVVFAVADGVLPSNDGEGYIVKMLLRRAARHAWMLGLRDPVLHGLVPQVVEAMGSAYPEIATNQERIQAVLKAEEGQFLKTLQAGIDRVHGVIDEVNARGADEIPGDVAFELWDTFGFPLDITLEMAAAEGLGVDRDGYARAREKAREASRGGGAGGELFHADGNALGRIAERSDESEFVGYDRTEAEATVVALLDGEDEVDTLGEGRRGVAILDRTPFYPEGGGQVGDPGKLEWSGGAAGVTGTTKSRQGLILHELRIVRGTLHQGQTVAARVDPARAATQKHHTATHLLHAALRAELGSHVAQAGSLVAPDRLRFDVSHPEAIGADQLARIETLVNRWIQADFAVQWRTVPIADARDAGAMMLFGEKYGAEVRMVSVGPGAEDIGQPGQDAISIELCGGTHVARTGEIGAFVITGESAVSAGVRRLEALAGMPAIAHLQELKGTVADLARDLGGAPDELADRVAKLQTDLKDSQRTAQTLRDKLAAAQTAGATRSTVREAAGIRYATQVLEGLDGGALRNAADTMLAKSDADLVVLASGTMLVAKASDEAQARGAHAGNLIREVAGRAGGGGGGRPDMAQAGAKDADKVAAALDAVGEILEALAKGS